MPQRKVWTQDQDKILRLLKQERAERKWANIARIMQNEFAIMGRTGKQCRERYHNHLDSKIINSEWTKEEEALLFQMHQQFGNKWSVISQKLPGRSDNCVKNHFYSKLRKALRRLNKIINDYFATQHKFIKESVLSKLIKTTESKFKNNSKIDQELAEFCNSIKNRLFSFQIKEGEYMEDADLAKKIIVDIQAFERDHKKGYKGIRLEQQQKYKTYLKPPQALRKKSSSQSSSSVKSEDSSFSFLSSSSYFSSSDLSDYQPDLSDIKPAANRSLGKTSGRNSCDISKTEEIDKLKQDQQQIQNHYENIIKPESFQIQHQNLLLDDSEFYERNNMREMQYNNMDFISQQSQQIQIGSILAPRQTFAPFYLFEKEQYKQEIQYKDDLDQMDIQ